MWVRVMDTQVVTGFRYKRNVFNRILYSIMLAGNDVSQILLSILVAYYGNYGNRPKWLGIGVLSASFSCFLAAVPHFIYGPGEDAVMLAQSFSTTSSNSSTGAQSTITNKNDLCYAPYIGDCSEGGSDFNSGYIGPVIILFISEFFVGIAVTVFYSIGLIYLDDNVNKKDSPFYFFNRFLVLTCVLLVCGFFILFFPRTLPSTLYKQIKRIEKQEEKPLRPDINKQFLLHYIDLAKEKQRFTKPLQSVASLVASIFGFGVSGIVIKIFRPGPRIITGYSCFLTVFGSLAMFGLMFIGCPKLDVIGPNYKSIEEHDKGLAMGVSTVLISLFSFIPAPIIMGAVVDSSCIIWDNTCGQKGNCWLYDSDKFRILIHVVPAVLMLISLLGDIFVFINNLENSNLSLLDI
ncbi:Solute carrier organic anion transporter family member 5A1 [Armadillidium vulgare]|nr:Solute carrier organic anion transporter family member 5A1 [Armadillidium vulgare]